MKISKEFEQVIADTFYDKEIDIYDIIEEIGEELDVIRKKGKIKEKLKCNVHFIGNEIAQKDFGLNIETNIMITCDNTVAKMGDIITYNYNYYTITGILQCDSHTKVFAKLGDSNV